MSYQRPPDYEAGAAGTTNPPGWYLDPIGLQSLRWWDGAQWARDTQPLLGGAWERRSPYPDAVASGYGAFGQPGPAATGSRTAGKVAWDMRRAWRQSHSLRSGCRRSRIQASLKTRRDRPTSGPAGRDRRLQRTTHHGSGGTIRPGAR